MSPFRLITASLLLLACSQAAHAHGDLHEQIARATQALAGDSNNIPLLLQRAELHRLHQAWGAALADFQRAAELDPQSAVVDFYRGRTLLEAGHPRAAVTCLDKFLRRVPAHSPALLTRARAHAQLGDHRAAAGDYTAALERVQEPQPDHFIERARVLAAQGRSGVDEAVVSLDEGLRRLGPLVVLQEEAMEMELRRGNFDAALARIDQIIARANRKEAWLTRRGAILEQANRTAEARDAYVAAVQAIEKLSPMHRETPGMVALEHRLRIKAAPPILSPPAKLPREAGAIP